MGMNFINFSVLLTWEKECLPITYLFLKPLKSLGSGEDLLVSVKYYSKFKII